MRASTLAKFCGKIGYVTTVETRPGIWEQKTVERNIVGDILSSTRRFVTDSDVNDDITLSNRLSIVADQYCRDHAYEMRYVEMMGAKWKISSIESQPPRLILNLGGVYVSQS